MAQAKPADESDELPLKGELKPMRCGVLRREDHQQHEGCGDPRHANADARGFAWKAGGCKGAAAATL